MAAGGVAVVIVLLAGRPLLHLAGTAWRDVDGRQGPAAGCLDDASRMNETPVQEIWPVPPDAAEAEAQLVVLLQRARATGGTVSIAGARHSMGGHCLAPGGVVIDMTTFNAMEFDEEHNRLRVQAGAKWSDVIPYLDRRGKSVAVMQSNNSFTVGGSLSVNCHGWQFGSPPIASSVESFRLLMADGTIVRCSRAEHPELFSLALGGYGLFGVILDVELRVVENECYRLSQTLVPVEDALSAFDRMTGDPEVQMVYARMGIVPDRFLQDVLVNVLSCDSAAGAELPELEDRERISLRRHLFRGSAASDYGKVLRWEAETKVQPHLRRSRFSRNQLLNEGVELFENRSAEFTDILHEYFLPRAGLATFVQDLREIIPRHRGDLLNVTVRQVETDEDTFLRYADQPMFSFVMLFYQPRTETGDQQMAAMTEELVEAALRNGGRYYLPYRLHATVDQFHRAYPQAEEFFTRKRKYDPDELFQNRFYLKYGRSGRPDREAF